MLNGVYVANINVGKKLTKGKEYEIIGSKIKFDNGYVHKFVDDSLNTLYAYVSGEVINYSNLLDFARPIKPKKILERFDTVEVVGYDDESDCGEFVVLGETLKRDKDVRWDELNMFNDDLVVGESQKIMINKITDKNGNVKWEREPQNHEVGKSIDEIERKIEELEAALGVLKTKLQIKGE